MNFYKRYPSDYGRKTARLTLAQHGAYTLMLDEFYSTEAPLAADVRDLFKVCRAMTKPEQDAVRFVADAFWPVGEDGMRHNNRATEELVEAEPAIEAARQNGKKGGRPRTTQKEPSGLSEQNPEGTQGKPKSKAPQSSEYSSLRSEYTRDARVTVPDLLADGLTNETASEWLAYRKRKGAVLGPKAWEGIKAEAVKAGLSPEDAVCKSMARGWQSFDAAWLKADKLANGKTDRQLETAALMTGGTRQKPQPETVDVESRIIPT